MPETKAIASQPQVRERASARTLMLLGTIALIAVAIDQTAKFFVTSNLSEGEVVSVFGDVLQLHFVKNSGAAFSLLSGSTWIFAIIASVVVVVIVFFARRIRSTAWAFVFGLLLGGTGGNLIDRLTREPGFGVGHVIDFIQVYGFPAIFNGADVAICTAMGLFILLSLRGIGLDGRRQPKSDSATVVPRPE